MDVSAVSSLISNLGFPIVCFLACAWYVKYREDKNDEKIEKIASFHNEENKRMVEAINNNTIAVTKLADILDSK